MNKLIPGSFGLFYTSDKKIVDCDNKEVILLKQNNKIKIYLNHKEEWIDETWLWLYTWFEYDRKLDSCNIRFIKVPVMSKMVPYRAIFIRPVYVDKIYRIVPSFPRYAVSKNGEVIKVKDRQKVSQRLNPYGYKVCGLFDPLTHRHRDVGVHELVANAWIYKRQNSLYTLVNHKNMDKTDNRAENLEWVNHSENLNHASKQKVYGKQRSCIIEDTLTNQKWVFKSMTDAAAHLDIDVSALKTIRFRQSDILKNRYKVKFVSKITPTISGSPSNLQQDVKIEFKDSKGDIQEFDSIRQASAATKINRNLLARLINSSGTRSFRGQVARRKSKDPWPKAKEISHTLKVYVYNKLTDKLIIYSSIGEAAAEMNMHRDVIKRIARDSSHPKYQIQILPINSSFTQ